jgi:hypothetical protein
MLSMNAHVSARPLLLATFPFVSDVDILVESETQRDFLRKKLTPQIASTHAFLESLTLDLIP